jgi:hypothetical protein
LGEKEHRVEQEWTCFVPGGAPPMRKFERRGELLAQMRLQAQMIGVRSNVLQTVYLAEISDLNGNLW